MRLWTLHPKYLDAKGLVALWREGLLAKQVLAGKTKGYRHHPQLIRFRAHRRPEAAIDFYLAVVCAEATRRGYAFDSTKLDGLRARTGIVETRGQVEYEWRHLMRKLRLRDPARRMALRSVNTPELHPLFTLVEGEVREWEKIGENAARKRRSATKKGKGQER